MEKFEFIHIETEIAIILMADNEKDAWIKLFGFMEYANEFDSGDFDLQSPKTN